MSKRTVKSAAPTPIPTALNISALARAAGVSRKTITRRLANGWRPEAPSIAPTPRTPAQAHPGRSAQRTVRIAIKDHEVAPITRAVKPVPTHERPPLGVVRGVLLLLAVAFYVLIALAAVHR